ncbi:protein GVQW3-like [Aethina tumida]|uniref:protein GVQW3-like n=1 Tax=Aethina tumida TaxID=116153 RepID=UPI00096B6265|nr:protein GVQW3-like [Aethina tumida]
MEKSEFRVLIKHYFLMDKNTVEAQQWLEKHYPDSSPSKPTICRWYAEFKRGRTDTNNAERSGRPLEAVTPENVSEVLRIVMKNRKVKVREIAEMTQISSGSVFTILHEKLNMKKVFSKWVPPLLSVEQNCKRQVHENKGKIERVGL